MLLASKRLLVDQSGATAIEYGLICAIISMVLIIVFNVGESLIASLERLIPALS
jgi:Flp pilus assembly pilin Flp